MLTNIQQQAVGLRDIFLTASMPLLYFILFVCLFFIFPKTSGSFFQRGGLLFSTLTKTGFRSFLFFTQPGTKLISSQCNFCAECMPGEKWPLRLTRGQSYNSAAHAQEAQAVFSCYAALAFVSRTLAVLLTNYVLCRSMAHDSECRVLKPLSKKQ